jgi:hypothetical protein
MKMTEKSKRIMKDEQKIIKINENLYVTKQKQKNKNNFQIKFITRIYHIIAKIKIKEQHSKFISKSLYFYIETFEASSFSLRDVKHDE